MAFRNAQGAPLRLAVPPLQLLVPPFLPVWSYKAMKHSVADNWAALRQLEEPHECMLLIETHKADPPLCFGLTLT